MHILRQRQVDQVQRLPPPPLHHLAQQLRAEERLGGRSGRNGHVGRAQRVGSVGPRSGAAGMERGKALGTRRRAVGHRQSADAARVQPLAGPARHRPGAEHQRVRPIDPVETLHDQIDRRGRKRRGVPADAGLRSYPLAGMERGSEQRVHHRAGAASLRRPRQRRGNLALDVGLAQQHRIEPGGHAHQVTGGAAVTDRRQACPGGRREVFPKHTEQPLGAHPVAVHLAAVTGRQRRPLRAPAADPRHRRAQPVGERGGGCRRLARHRRRKRAVIQKPGANHRFSLECARSLGLERAPLHRLPRQPSPRCQPFRHP